MPTDDDETDNRAVKIYGSFVAPKTTTAAAASIKDRRRDHPHGLRTHPLLSDYFLGRNRDNSNYALVCFMEDSQLGSSAKVTYVRVQDKGDSSRDGIRYKTCYGVRAISSTLLETPTSLSCLISETIFAECRYCAPSPLLLAWPFLHHSRKQEDPFMPIRLTSRQRPSFRTDTYPPLDVKDFL